MQVSSDNSPVGVRTWQEKIGPGSVDVSLTAFGNMNMLVFTDTGSMGVLIKARCLPSPKTDERCGPVRPRVEPQHLWALVPAHSGPVQQG